MTVSTGLAIWFQSAPAPVGAGDVSAGHFCHLTRGFNPRPLPWERATAVKRVTMVRDSVSIRARSRGSGRPGHNNERLRLTQFQSAPAPVGAGDRYLTLYRVHFWRFNPRPLPWERATDI